MNIYLKHLKKRFETSNHNEPLFQIEDFVLDTGKVHGLIGPNGVGKTTLIRMIAGLDREYSGQIEYNGKLFHNDLVKKITYIRQNPYMLSRSIYENVAYPLKLRNLPKEEIKKRTESALEQMGLVDIKDRKATVLSAGEREKVSMLRGLISSPELILLDEPTANIDPDTVKDMESLLNDYKKSHNATIIIVTHNMAQAIRLCDTVSILKNQTIAKVDKKDMQRIVDLDHKMEQLLNFESKILGV